MVLDDISVICHQISSEKITERKKAVDRLKQLLNNSNVLALINSKSRAKSGVTWNKLFESSVLFFDKEVYKLEQDERKKENPSAATRTNRENAKRMAIFLPKLILKNSCQSIPFVNANLVCDFVLKILKRENPYRLENYATDAFHIIQKYILRHSIYYMNFSQKNWKDILHICIFVYGNVRNIDKVSVLNVVEESVTRFDESRMTSVNLSSPSVTLKRIKPFLKEIVNESISQKNYGIQRAVISLFYSICSKYASQWRCLLCQIGEETFESILSIWEKKTDEKKVILLKYLDLQLILHSSSQDQICRDLRDNQPSSQCWQKNMRQLYLVIYEHIMEVANSCRISGNVSLKEFIPNEFEVLAARLCSQLFNDYEEITTLDVTQVGAAATQTQTSSFRQISKKRKIVIGFSSICEKLQDYGTLEETLPWYRIIHKMLQNHSEFFNIFSRKERLMDTLIQVFKSCKSSLVIEEISRCLIELSNQDSFPSDENTWESSRRNWTQVAELTLRLISSKQGSNIGMELFSNLISKELIPSQMSLYRIFLRGHILLNKESLVLLQTVLLKFPIPKKLKSDDYPFFDGDVINPRMLLLNILLPLEVEMENKPANYQEFAVNYPREMANVILLLIVENSHKVKVKNGENFCMKSHTVKENEVLNSLDFSEAHPTTFIVNVVERIKIFIRERLSDVSENECLKERIHLSLNLTEFLLILSSQPLVKRPLEKFLKIDFVLKYIEGLISSSVQSSTWNEINNLSNRLVYLLNLAKNLLLSSDEHMDKLDFLELIPVSFQDSILQFIKTKERPKVNQLSSLNVSSFSRKRQSFTVSGDSDSDSDDSFDENQGLSLTGSHDDSFDFDNGDLEEETKIEDGNLFTEELNEKDKAFFSFIEYLAKCYEITVISDPEVEFEDLKFTSCLNFVYDLVESDKASDKIIVLGCIRMLFTMHFREENMTDGLKMLYKLCEYNSSDTKIIAHSLKLLKDLLMINGKNLEDEEKQLVVRFVGTAATKFSKGMYGFNISELIFDCVVWLTKLDPLRTWSKFSVSNDDGRISINKNEERLCKLPNLLQSPYHSMRIKVIENVHLLFKDEGKPLPTSYQNRNFEELYETAMDCLHVEDELNKDFLEDEERCRVASFLLCLIEVANNSSALEPQALYAVISSVKVNNIDVKIVKAALTRIVLPSNTELCVYLDFHFSYILNQWLKDKHSLNEFPYQLFDLKDLPSFCRHYRNQIISSLFAIDEGVSEIEKLSQILNEEVKVLLESNFSNIMANLLPYLVVSVNSEQKILQKFSKTKISLATRKWKFLEDVLEEDCMTLHIKNDIGEVVCNLLRMTYDSSRWSEEEVDIPPPHHSFDLDTILFILNNSHDVFFKDQKSLLSLLCGRKSAINSILHGLFCDVATSASMKSCRVRLSLSPFEVFLHWIISGIEDELGEMKAFLIRKVTRILTNFIIDFSEDYVFMAAKCCDLLYGVILVCLNDQSSIGILTTTLKSVITSLYSLHCLPSVWKYAYKVLALIFNSDSEDVKKLVANIAPFTSKSDDKNLKELHIQQQNLKNAYQINMCLKKSVEAYLALEDCDITTYDIENIVHLLSEKKHEIFELYSSYSSNELINLAHQLIFKFVEIVSNANNEKNKILGLEGLGKLGPVSLGSSVFLISSDNCLRGELGMLSDILTFLNRLTFSRDYYDVDSSEKALRQILSMKEVYQAVTLKLNNKELIQDLLPFLPTRKPKLSNRVHEDLSMVEFEAKVGKEDIWVRKSDFESWIKNLTVALIESGCGSDIFNYLIPVCKLSVNFCEFLFPYVLLFTLKVDCPDRRDCISRMIVYALQELTKDDKFNDSQTHKRRSANESHVIKSCLRTIIRAINFLRTQDPSISFSKRKVVTSWDRNLWLDIDFSLVSKASFMCEAYYSSILFGEIACDIILEESVSPALQNQNRYLPPLQRIANTSNGRNISHLLLQSSNAICDSEGVEGCGGLSSITDGVVQLTLSQHRGNDAQALYLCDTLKSDKCLINNLKNVGMYGMLYKLTQHNPDLNHYSSEAKAECAWRLGLWEDCDDEFKSRTGFNQHFFVSLKCLKENDMSRFEEAKTSFYKEVSEYLKESGNESSSSIYQILGNLQIFSELSDIFNFITSKSKQEISSLALLLDSSWRSKDDFGPMDKEMKEIILSARISTLRCLSQVFKEHNSVFQDLIFKLLLKKCEIGNLRESFDSLLEAKKIKVNVQKSWQLRLQEVNLALSLNNTSQAVCTLEDVLQDIKNSNLSKNEKLGSHYETLVLYGKVLTKSRTQSPEFVIENYFQEAINLIENTPGGVGSSYLEDCYHSLASFGDCLYQEVKESLSSDNCQNRIKHIEQSAQELGQLQELISSIQSNKGLSTKTDPQEKKSLHRRFAILERDIAREEAEINLQKKEAEYFFALSLENYLKVLCCSSKYDLNIFRIVALWLENLKSEKANILVSKYSSNIKSHKFIPLLYQLVARLTCINDPEKQHKDFCDVLSSILERVCLNHPHHGLPVVLMLANSHLDEITKQNKRGRAQQEEESVLEEDRVRAAKKLVLNMKKTKLVGHIEEMEKVFLAYITLANREDKKSLIKKSSTNSLMMNLCNLEYTAPLTRPVRIDHSAVYSVPVITNWESSVELVGGVNIPLKMSVLSSDGFWSHELLKGNDDLRQDAVLEQVFSVVNELLRKDKEAIKQKLSVKTYLVVPLSQKTGLIQWCDNTTTFGSYLMDCHNRYYPNDLSVKSCRDKFEKAANKVKAESSRQRSDGLDILVQTMEEVLEVHHPVFRYFFYEQYPYPEKWFTHRRSYTCSVATSSIAGYILGLGDRHVQNLLIDINSAEIIHIDLGIAFENGKLLPTPEKVPFRLTQNIIDGFGAMGVEGTLRKTMETTMRVLREAKTVLITIVEVLRHDPLHHWTLSPAQTQKLQRQQSLSQEFNLSTEGTNSASMAERALVRVQQKLNGLQNGLVVSVPEHVGILIQQAMDIKNLSCMYYGWQPYL